MRALVFVSVLSLTACVAGPNFVPPKPPTADKFTTEELPNIELATLIRIQQDRFSASGSADGEAVKSVPNRSASPRDGRG